MISTRSWKLIESFDMEIIFVTHRPELVVNLDVDNVIILELGDEQKLEVHSGALEYEDEQVNIIDKVANNLDGGVEIIRKRWKRYDK